MKTQLSTYFSLDCQTNVKKLKFRKKRTSPKKDNFFATFILTDFLHKLLMVQLIISRRV